MCLHRWKHTSRLQRVRLDEHSHFTMEIMTRNELSPGIGESTLLLLPRVARACPSHRVLHHLKYLLPAFCLRDAPCGCVFGRLIVQALCILKDGTLCSGRYGRKSSR
jgi:hypothetical protein